MQAADWDAHRASVLPWVRTMQCTIPASLVLRESEDKSRPWGRSTIYRTLLFDAARGGLVYHHWRMIAFDKREYARIQGQLTFAPALLPTLGVLILDLALLYAIALLIRGGTWTEYCASQLLIPVVCFHNFSLMHECGHGSASRSRALNLLIGHYASLFCFVPYFSWKYIHQQHHAWAGNLDKDPVLRSLRTFRDHGTPALARVGWRSWIPVSAFLQHLVYLSYPLKLARERASPRARLLHCVLSSLWIVGVYAAVAVYLPALAHPRNWAVGATLFLIAEELVNIPHHVGMPIHEGRAPAWEQHHYTRSCYYPAGLSELFVLNFNFHIEHHLFPSLPWYRLRAARRRLKPALDRGYSEALGAEWNIRNRRYSFDHIVARYRTNALPPRSPESSESGADAGT
ncbi:MAG TPA: fatty acid desaturase [Polyangiales bacterium]|nr:fatty acid desaturase [Polyangiales bacterium]